MKISTALLLLAGSLSIAAVAPASAEVTKTVTYRGGPSHGCKIVKMSRPTPFGRKVMVKKICG